MVFLRKNKAMQASKITFYQTDFLNQMRQTGDVAADELVRSIFESGEAAVFHRMFKDLIHNRDLDSEALPVELRDFAKNHLQIPAWLDAGKLKKGIQVFHQNAEPILTMLGFLSLPYCYAAAQGAEVLLRSERIKRDTKRRLLETAQFVLDVMHPEGFEPQGKAVATILKVRLMHATIRYHLGKSKDWDKAWGVPVNQEDMGGTNGAFSWISLRGLRKMGYTLNVQESESYLYLWNVIGTLLGVRAELLPDTAKEAFWLDKKIAERHFYKSEAGVELTKALRTCLAEDSKKPFPAGFADAYMRFLLGDKIADLLEIPPSNWTSNLIPLLKFQNVLQNTLPTNDAQKQGMMHQMIAEEVLKDPVTFAFPMNLPSAS